MLKNTEHNKIVADALRPYLCGAESEARAAEVLGCSISKVRKMISAADCERTKTGMCEARALVASGLVPADAFNHIYGGVGIGGMHSLDGFVECPLEVMRDVHPALGDMAEVSLDEQFTHTEKYRSEPKIRRAHAALTGFLNFIHKTKNVCTPVFRRHRHAAE